MMKEIVKGIYDIAHENDVTVDVAADMFKHNVVMKEEINKGADFDFSVDVDSDVLDEALSFAASHYSELTEAYTNGTFDDVFVLDSEE